MFEFFEKIAEGIGFKLIDNFSNKVNEWIKKEFESTKENKITELRKILIDDYGAERFWNLIDEN